MSTKSGKRVVVLGTGGTIAGLAPTADDNVGYTAGQVGIAQLVGSLPGLAGRPLQLVAEQVAQIDSKDMSFGLWQLLAQRCAHWLALADVSGIVITHGTDTMEETAFFLHIELGRLGYLSKPIVLTGAMRPASSMAPDGPQNLLDSLSVVTHPDASGVTVVFAGTVYGAVEVQKVHPYRLDAFDGGDAGPLGFVEEGKVRQVRDWDSGRTVSGARPRWISRPGGPAPSLPLNSVWPRVEIVMNYAGAGGFVVEGLLAHGAAAGEPVRGIVVAATGNGTLHQDLEVALLRAQSEGVRVVRATRCSRGRVLAQSGDAIPDSHGLSPVKARIALMLDLMESH